MVLLLAAVDRNPITSIGAANKPVSCIPESAAAATGHLLLIDGTPPLAHLRRRRRTRKTGRLMSDDPTVNSFDGFTIPLPSPYHSPIPLLLYTPHPSLSLQPSSREHSYELFPWPLTKQKTNKSPSVDAISREGGIGGGGGGRPQPSA